MKRPQDRIRELADNLDQLELETGVRCKMIGGQAIWGKEQTYLENVDSDKFWHLLKIDNYGFIGIMPNQWRPEIQISLMWRGIRIPLYKFVADGYHTYNGGFLDNFDKIWKDLFNAPWFIKIKLIQLYEVCTEGHAGDMVKLNRLLENKKNIEAEIEKLSN